MDSTKILKIAIDPSGAQTGGRVVSRVIDDIAKSAMTTKDRIEELAMAQAQAAKSAQGSFQIMAQAQDALRAKFNPTFAVLQRYKQTQEEIRMAHRLGALSVNEMTTALSRERQAALSNIAAIKGYNTALAGHTAAVVANNSATKMAAFQRTNLIYQLNDVGVSLASGMSPLMVLLQQGPQIAQLGGGVGKAFKEIAVMATGLAARLWPLAGVYGAYRLVSSFSAAARTDVDALTRSMAEQAMSASSLRGATSEFTQAQGALIDAVGIKGAIGELITLQGNYSTAISNTATIQTSASSSIVADLRREYGAKRQLLEVESQLQQAKLATMRADLTAKSAQLQEEVMKQVLTRGDLVAQGFEDPRVGRLTQIPDSVSGLAKLQEQIAKNPLSLEIKKMQAELTLAEVAANQLNAALGKSFEGAAVQNGLDGLSKLSATTFSQPAQGANTFSTAVGGIATATQTASNGVINVTEAMAKARRQSLTTMQDTTAQVRTMKTELADIQATLAAAGNIPADSIFGKNMTGQAASDALAKAADSIQKIMKALDQGGMVASTAHEGIEMVRASLIQMGGDTKAVNLLIDSLVAGYMRAMDLKGAVDQLSQSIMGIPNRVVSIGIQQYTVPSANGGKTGVNVYGGQADFNYQQYNVGGGKTVGVSAGNGNYSNYGGSRGYLVEQSDIQNMYIDKSYGGARAAGGPVVGGKQYLVGENGPELVTMGGAGQVTNANSTASILLGGRDTLSLIEDHLYSVMQELRIHTGYWETAESNASEMIACLQAIKSVQSTASYPAAVRRLVAAAAAAAAATARRAAATGSTTRCRPIISTRGGPTCSAAGRNTARWPMPC